MGKHIWRIEQKKRFALFLALFCFCFISCSSTSISPAPRSSPTPGTLPAFSFEPCSAIVPQLSRSNGCLTPDDMRQAYGVSPLIARGLDGKGETIIDIVSYGSPELQQDLDLYDQVLHLPALTVPQLSPLGTVPYNAQNIDMVNWSGETIQDVEVIHAIAPGAKIIVLTDPVDETEGMAGLPQILQLEQYAVAHRLGQIICQSFATTEINFPDAQSQHFLQQYSDFVQSATTSAGWTIFAASGDTGSTGYNNTQSTAFPSTRSVYFPADLPWVTAVGGTTIHHDAAGHFTETTWPGSGGGFSAFFPEPAYQQLLSQTLQAQFHGERGLPDVSADADRTTGVVVYVNGQWEPAGGTSASQPTWSAIMAIADQMAGHPLGFINQALYKVGTSSRYKLDFHDITTGNNTHTAGVLVPGYAAVSGWDPATGFGSPIASQLLPDLIAAINTPN